MTIRLRFALPVPPALPVLPALLAFTTLLTGPRAHAQGVLHARLAPEAAAASATLPDRPLTLEHESLQVTIDEQFASTTLGQTFANRTEHRLEGRYLLHTGEGASVDGFAYWNGATRIVGEVFEKQVARQVYEHVTGLGRDPGLLEQEGEGAFSFRVFPIVPGERKRVEVRFGQYLPRTGDTVEYRVPLGLAAATVDIEIHDGRLIREVSSTTHVLEVSRQGAGRVRVKAHPARSGAAELLLRYRIDEQPWTVSAAVHRDPGQSAYVAIRMALPETAAAGAISDKDVTLVIDRSGSMSGDPLTHALAAAHAVVGRLRSGDRVNVIAFDDQVTPLFDLPRPADPETRRRAEGFLRGVQSGGGTDIAGALSHALGAQNGGRRPHVILFFTDGQSSSQEALAAARTDRGDARVYTIGLGSGVDKPLLSRLAAEKRGRFTFISSAAAIEAAVARLFRRIESPLFTNIRLESTGAPLTRIYPRTLPDMAPGDEVVIMARAPAAAVDPIDVALLGDLSGSPTAFSATAAMPTRADAPWVGRLWARSRVEDLLEEIALRGETDELKAEVIDLALAYDLVTPYTSFLAIPESELDAEARDALMSARERKARVLATHEDAVALSRNAMPPGDPLLSIKARRDAQQVTAYFPFGLVKDLTWDESAEQWQVRFLVPKHVTDGEYTARILIVNADGSIELASARYTIDSTEPDFELEITASSTGVQILLRAGETVREATVALVSDPRRRITLSPLCEAMTGDGDAAAGSGGDTSHAGASVDAGAASSEHLFEGFLALPAGRHRLRIVVADRARNEADQLVTVEVR